MTGPTSRRNGVISSDCANIVAPVLEQHCAELLPLHNRLHTPWLPLSGLFAGQAIQIRWGLAGALGSQLESLVLWLGDECLQLRFTTSVLTQFLIDPNPMSPRQTMDAELDALLVELALLACIEPLEALLDVELQVRPHSQSKSKGFVLTMGFTLILADNTEHPIQLDMTHGAAIRIAGLLQSIGPPQPAALAGLIFSLAVEAGYEWLSLRELRLLAPGDVVMLQVPTHSGVRLVLNDTLQAKGVRHELHAVRLLESMNLINPNMDKPMNSPDEVNVVDETLNELQLKLVCQIGTVELSLAQLQRLGSGSLLQLTTQARGAVDLLINGQCVGRGNLVQIGDGLGVRLLSFAKP